MKIRDTEILGKFGETTIYTVALEPDVFVDVKHIGTLWYVMDCEDGYEAYNSDGNTFEYHFDENEVIAFVKANARWGEHYA